ncbi:MAG: hypothetical protein HC897_20165, partial [Thermoanaerobaculia bacterium]|nr:hypothetical protein [Thermoanaerobaculia bacterium]
MRARLVCSLLLASLLTSPAFAALCTVSTQTTTTDLPHPILFVTQFPIANDFATIGSTFANHFSESEKVGRGGDLYILYTDGLLCNLTREGGFGTAATFQGATSIAVRDPNVHWDGTRALFSMVIGSATQQFQVTEEYWQLYEVTGLARNAPLTITKIPNQPSDTNNVTPIYVPGGRIVFTTDRPRDGRRHLYPQHDEYESTPTNTGLWSLDPTSGELHILSQVPSGAFTPMLDSFGRVLFTRWDHLQRDQQADAPGNPYGTFNWTSEEPDAAVVAAEEVFPEPRNAVMGSNVEGFTINHFFPWQIHPDGREEETLNHIGRHELHSYFNRSFNDDPNLDEFISAVSGRLNPNSIQNFFQIAEDPQNPGTYFGVDAPEFQTHASGLIAKLSAPPAQHADQIVVTYVTHPDTRDVIGDGDPVPPTHSGHYRNPLPLSDGKLLAAHTAEARAAGNEGTRPNPDPRYDFRIKRLVANGSYRVAGTPITGGIVRQIQYWDPDVMVSYTGQMWELQPVEVRSRTAPPTLTAPLPGPESQIFAQEQVDPEALRSWMQQRGLALVVSRDITTRDQLDLQQPYNLRVPGGAQTTPVGGIVYDVKYMQFFQGDQLRGITFGGANPRPGRRVIAQVMHDPAVINPP